MSVNYVHHLTQALQAKELYQRDKDYLVPHGEVKIVDEFTGRILEGRRWSDGLHQAVEAKERVKIKEENHTWATVTLQNYFRLYEKLGGHDRHGRDRGLRVRQHLRPAGRAHPHQQPMVRDDQPDLIYKTEDAKFDAVVEDIVERYETGQPVLVGTASVAKSEHLSRLLEQRGIPHEVLNAKQHTREAEIVAQAGRLARRHGGHQHGRSWRRHHPRRQPRGAGPPRGDRPRASTSTPTRARPSYEKLLAKYEEECSRGGRRGPRARRPLRARAASATRAAASTTSCGAARAARATRARAASSCRSRTS